MFFNKVLEKKKIVLIILAIFLVLGIITGIICKKEKYIASSTILLKSNDPQYSLTTSKYNTYKQIIKNDETLNKIENQTGIVINYRELAKSIGISREADSNTMNIIIKREKQDEAVILLNSLINNFSKKIPEIYEDEEVVVLDHSHIIEKVSNVNFILIIPLSIVCSAIVSAAYIYTHILIENKKKAKKEIEENTLTKPLISIPLNKTKSKLLISAENEKYLRPFDNLKTTIQFINFNKESKKSILITSLFDCEGKSYIAANLAISYALAGKRVVLIDADMDSGTQSKLFDVPNNLGFSNYLSSLNENGIESEELINKYINETSVNNLNLITSGTIPPNSQELLYGDKIETLVKDLSTFFDIIIIDGRSIANRVDSLVLTRFVDSTLIIATPKNAKTEELIKARKDILNVGGNPIGIIINMVKIKKILDLSLKLNLIK